MLRPSCWPPLDPLACSSPLDPSVHPVCHAERHGPGSGTGTEQLQLSLAAPHSFDELRAVRRTLELYRQNYAVHVAALLLAAHIFLQVSGCGPCRVAGWVSFGGLAGTAGGGGAAMLLWCGLHLACRSRCSCAQHALLLLHAMLQHPLWPPFFI